MNKIFLILVSMSLLVLTINIVSASDVLVWQGQYYTGTTFNTGNYEFNFSVYDALTEGNICYTNTTTLTTGNFGEWRTDQSGVSSSCNNASKSYFLNININGVEQTPRRRLMVFDFLRKNVDEISNGSIETDIVKVRVGLKDLNKVTWQFKLNYARDLANTTLHSEAEAALKLITTTTTTTITTTGESTEFKIIKLQQAGEQAKTLINSELGVAQAKILEAKRLALLNGETQADLEAIEAEANLHTTALNLTAQAQNIIIEQALNNSITEVINSDDGIRFCLSNGTNCQNNPIFNNITANNGFFSFLGTLTNRLTKLWVQDIDASGTISGSGNINTTGDINTTKNIKGDVGFFRRIDVEEMIILDQIDHTSVTCDASLEGAMIYSSNDQKFYGCRNKRGGDYEWKSFI